MLLQSPSLETARSGFASEVKYLVSRLVAAEIREWAREHLIADPHGEGPAADTYTITSLYLDTPSFEVLRKIGSHGRSKYRVRRYGESESVFLERKMKRQGRVGKRRTETPAAQITDLASGAPRLLWSGYWFHRRLVARQLRPVCQISYSRTARFAATPEGRVRLTLDENITAIAADQYAFDSTGDPIAIAQEQVILELKYRGTEPDIFADLTRRFALTPHPASKYRMAAGPLGLASVEGA